MQIKPSKKFDIELASQKLMHSDQQNPPAVLTSQLIERVRELKELRKLKDVKDAVDPGKLEDVNVLKDLGELKEVNDLKEGMGDKIKNRYSTLVSGPSGSGMAFVEQMLADDKTISIYRIDLSMVISKYIGETEKNLEQLFEQAEQENWILFFDEADALFGKRTNVGDAHDRYANQEVAYLLQKIESYEGISILATNRKMETDDELGKHFNTIINFPFPRAIVTGTRYVLAVKDLQKSADYYLQQLGFKTLWADEGWHFVIRDSIKIMLGECPDDTPAFETGCHSYFGYIEFEGIDDLYQEYVSKGVEIMSTPENKPWGQREFAIRTIDGHRIMFGEKIASANLPFAP